MNTPWQAKRKEARAGGYSIPCMGGGLSVMMFSGGDPDYTMVGDVL